MTERDFAIDVVRTLQAAGHQAVFAGGCVRDQLLGLDPDDYDVATDATPERVQTLFRRTIAIGASFGVIEVLGPKLNGEWLKVQVATFRSDGVYSDGRRPDSVTYGNAEEDAKRRDFTINGVFYDPVANQLLDYVGGQADLNAKILRAIGDPHERFREDKLRMLRAVRMAMRFDLAVNPATLAAARSLAGFINQVSVERVAEELRKLLTSPARVRGLELLREFNLINPMNPVLPEVAATFDEALAVIKALPAAASFELTMAALLPNSKGCGRRLKLSNEERERIDWLVAHRDDFADVSRMPASKLYPILVHPGAVELIALNAARGNAGASHAEEILGKTSVEILDPLPLLTGKDLLAAGWQPSRDFKTVLQRVRDAQLDGEIGTMEEAIIFAERTRQQLM